MHLLRYQLAASLDGLIAPPDGGVDWLAPYEGLAGEVMGPWMKEIGGLLLGRATWDQAQSLGGWMFGDMPALLLTSRPLPKKPPASVEVFSGDPAEGLKRLRARVTKGDIWLFGGGATAASYLKAGALLFRGRLATTLSAWVCGSCGYVEFYADSPQNIKVPKTQDDA
jgi:dihydrofolate reductase